jgi:hypothetical protein
MKDHAARIDRMMDLRVKELELQRVREDREFALREKQEANMMVILKLIMEGNKSKW